MGKILQNLRIHGNSVKSADFSTDEKTIVTSSWDKTARILKVASGKPLQEMNEYKEILASPQFSPDGKSILTNSNDHKTIL